MEYKRICKSPLINEFTRARKESKMEKILLTIMSIILMGLGTVVVISGILIFVNVALNLKIPIN